MEVNGVVIAIVAIVAVHFIYSQYIESTKDVNDLFLSLQSTIDPIRLPDESPIYKSNKLDYSNGLRVGLEIRYDHYKLRNGNLSDIWQILIAQLKAAPEKLVQINEEVAQFLNLNYKVAQLGELLSKYEEVTLNFRHFVKNSDILVIIIACFVNQITLHLYDDLKNVEFESERTLSIIDNSEVATGSSLSLGSAELSKIFNSSSTLSTFDNEYHFSKDRGTAIRITSKLNTKFISKISFTQLNLISAIASSMKHLPITCELTKNDTLLLVQDSYPNTSTVENIGNDLVKILLSFITGSNLVIQSELTSEKLSAINPSILSTNDSCFEKLLVLSQLESRLSWFDKFFYNQSINFLSRGKFSNQVQTDVGSKLRLVYINKSIYTQSSILSDSNLLNKYRSLLNSRIIIESEVPSIVGPFILTDYFDYRILDLSNINNFRGFGCICQSNEIKLVNYKEGTKSGSIVIRGYNIGKKKIIPIDSNFKINSDPVVNEGFMPIDNVKGSWGNDGCLYVYS